MVNTPTQGKTDYREFQKMGEYLINFASLHPGVNGYL
jgi:hypothetical protein